MGMMNKSVVQKLFDINGQFYQEYGQSFAETRRRVQPGVLRVLDEWIKDGNWLDLGCGSGALGARWLGCGTKGLYEGLDFSSVLINEANATTGQMPVNENQKILYVQCNLADENWVKQASLKRYDGVLMFAALHHLPGVETRKRLLKQIAGLIAPGSLFIHSEWQFQRSAKLMARVQPWQSVGLTPEELDPGDTLLDWRHTQPDQQQKAGLRYVHLFDREELQHLADETGFKILSEFDSDGTSGNLSLYQIWQRL
jgi:tRNA (uracil-5-)-methyltransferase TRM9